MIHLNTLFSKGNEDVNEVDLNTHLSKRNEDVNEVDDSFEHALTKEKWRCKWNRWFISTHTYQREMKMWMK